jgi:hypothetical protein
MKRLGIAGGLLFFLLRGLASAHAENSAGLEKQIREHLAAGEFGPARNIAQSVSSAEVRDSLLQTIAGAQFAAGGQHASLATIGLMDDDRARISALDAISAHSRRPSGAGGGMEADFEGLMDLIKSTVAPSSWDDVGGLGSVSPFQNGVIVDPQGVLQRISYKPSSKLTAVSLVAAIETKNKATDFAPGDPRANSRLRKISLPRLERALQLRLAAGLPPSEEMQLLAGMQKVQYVLTYPETRDLVLAGPAGEWKRSSEGRLVGAETGRPVLRLDDLLTLWRQCKEHKQSAFGCSITPTQDGLKQVKAFVEASAKRPLKPGRRDAWLGELRDQLGRQTIEIFGIDPRTRVAQTLVEADYHMKLIGMGLEDGTVGVVSYLDSIPTGPGQSPPPMDVLRWWFTMNYPQVQITEKHNAFEIRGPGVQVLSENELLVANGERVHTGRATELNRQFSQSFTQEFSALAIKHPVYAELQNVFDLALAVAIVEREHLADQVGWHALSFGDADRYAVQASAVPREVESIINHREISESQIVVGVSGGVRVEPWQQMSDGKLWTDRTGQLEQRRKSAAPKKLEQDIWWWD